jgi:hypothetical protein
MSRHHRAFMEDSMPKITRKSAGGGCSDDHCPAIHPTDDLTETGITIRLPGPGDDLTAVGPDVPGEITGFIPTAILRAWASEQQ